MTSRPARIAKVAAIQVTTMLGSAFVLFAVAEGINWFACWRQAREDG